MIHKIFVRTNIIEILLILVSGILISDAVIGEDKGEVAVLPFEINSLNPMDSLKQGLQEMVISRLSEKGLRVVNADTVTNRTSAFPSLISDEDLRALGKDLGAAWLIRGSFTQIGNKISLDMKIVDTSGAQSPFSAFVAEDDMGQLDKAVVRAVAEIYNVITGVMPIERIRVMGNKRIESEAILALVDSKEGDEIDYNQFDKDLRAIFRMGYFDDVRIEMEDGLRGKIVTLRVVEKPSITKILFKGNEKEKDDDLMDQLGIKRYSILNLSEIKQSINRLKEYYRQKGYYNVEISESIEDLPNNEVSLTYTISEGKKVYIKKILFVGNEQFTDKELKKEMETSEKGFFSWLTNSGKLDEKKLEFDVHKLTAFYNNRGYIKAKVGEPTIQYENEALTITMEIIEGPLYKVNSVTIEGDLIKPVETLLAKIEIRQEKYFNREVVRSDIMRLRDSYAEEGYAYADVIPVINEDDTNHWVDILFKISKKERVRFERINIAGNTETRDKVIRREFTFAEGDYFNGKALKQGTRRLYRLDFFETVDVQPRKGSEEDLMILDIAVKERPTGQFSLGVGYSSYEKTMTNFEVAKRNLFGRAHDVSAKAMFGSRTTNYTLSFEEPWLFDRPISAGISLYQWTYDSEYDQYDQKTRGGSLSFGFPLKIDDYTKGSVKYALDESNIYNIEEDAIQEIKDQKGLNVTSSMTFGITRDSKNRFWMATEGSLNRLTFKYAGGVLGGDAAFNKYEARSAWYFPLWWDTIFMAQGRAGMVRKRSDGILPYGEKFKLGGINSIRGYQYGDISPKSPAGYSVGGEDMWVINLEYLFPLQKEQGVMGLLLFDAGNVYRESDNVFKKGDDFFLCARRSIGGGIRWLTPMGLLRLEYGRKLDKEPDESSGDWEFTIGGVF